MIQNIVSVTPQTAQSCQIQDNTFQEMIELHHRTNDVLQDNCDIDRTLEEEINRLLNCPSELNDSDPPLQYSSVQYRTGYREDSASVIPCQSTSGTLTQSSLGSVNLPLQSFGNSNAQLVQHPQMNHYPQFTLQPPIDQHLPSTLQPTIVQQVLVNNQHQSGSQMAEDSTRVPQSGIEQHPPLPQRTVQVQTAHQQQPQGRNDEEYKIRKLLKQIISNHM